MNEADIDLLYADVVETDRGDGVRIYTAQDEVYEALEDADGVETRLFPDDDGWWTTVRVPVDGEREQDAYRTFRTVADRIEDAYDMNLSMSWLDFQAELAEGIPSRRAEHDGSGSEAPYGGGIRVRYREEGMQRIPEKDVQTYGEPLAYVGGAGGVAGLMGAGIAGVPALPEMWSFLAIPAVAAGAAGGGLLGYAPFKLRRWYANRKRRKRYSDPDVVVEDTLLDRINERNSLERLLDRNQPMPDRLTERYNELLEQPLDEQWDIVRRAHFERFDLRQGVTAETRFDTYKEAAAFTDVVRGRPEGSYERPSPYQDSAAFEGMFQNLVHTVDGETHVLDDARVMAGNVVAHGAAEDVRMFLEESYPDLVMAAGRDYALSTGGLDEG